MMRFSMFCGGLCLTIGSITTLGWLSRMKEFAILYKPFDWSVPMAFPTGLMFVCLGIMIVGVPGSDKSTNRYSAVAAAALAILMTCAYTLPNYIRPFVAPKMDIDVPPAMATLMAMAMAALSAFNREKMMRPAGMIIAITGAMGLLGYLFKTPRLYAEIEGVTVGMAINTSFGFLFGGLGLMTVRIEGTYDRRAEPDIKRG